MAQTPVDDTKLQGEPDFIERREDQLPPSNENAGEMSQDAKATAGMRAAPAGDPPADYDVRSVYDSRPVQGFDFNITAETGETSSPFTVEWIVPEGFVAVVRALHHWFNPAPLIASREDVLLTLLRDGSDVRFNVEIPVGSESDELVKVFAIYDEFQTVGARLVNVGLVNTAAFVHFYGNFLLKTDTTPAFQIANQVGKKLGPPRVAPAPLVEVPQAIVTADIPARIQPTMTAPPVKPGFRIMRAAPHKPPRR